MNRLPTVSDAESHVMAELWKRAPQNAVDLAASLDSTQGWLPSTVKTLLNRLLHKGAVAAERDGRRFLYSPVLERDAWLRNQSVSLIDRLFGGRLAVVVLRSARPLLLRQGAGLTYATWWLVPALMLPPALPRPNTEPLHVELTAAGGATTADLMTIPVPHPSNTAPWLALWLAGTIAVLAMQTCWQVSLARLGERLDNLWNMLAALFVAQHWWNPLTWWAARRLQADQELARDAAVLASWPGCGQTYVRALLAAHNLEPQGAPIAGRWASAHPLIERLAMLKHPLHASRRVVVLMVCALAACAGLAWASQAAATVDATGPRLKLSLLIAQQVGDRVNRLSLALAGRQGEPMRMHNPGDGSEANPPLALDLTASIVDPGKVQIDAVIWEGRPLAITARPRLLLTLNAPGMVEQIEPGSNRRISLVVVPSLFERP